MSLLSAFRSRDGRSLGRALIALVLVNAIAVGLQTGMLAEARAATVVLCAVSADDASLPSGHRDVTAACCVAGCGTAAAGLPAPSLAAVSAPVVAAARLSTAPASITVPPVRTDSAPRGPPILG